MTNQEARQMLDEHRTINPRKVVRRTLYVLSTARQRAGLPNCVEVYRLSASGKRAIFESYSTPDQIVHLAAVDWLRTHL